MLLRKQKLIIIFVIILTVLTVTAIIFFKHFNINFRKKCECRALSKSTLGAITDQTGEIVIPANSGIVKITGSALSGFNIPIDGAVVLTTGSSQYSFSHVFRVEPLTGGGQFEINFDEPVYIGDEDVTFTMLAIREDGDPIAFYMSLTVAYIPDCV